ncbi:hypothetical protein Gpo141_00004860 [Globisporangium polare]
MLNIAFLLDITGSMFNQLSGVKQTVAQLVKSVFEEDPRDLMVTIITFTESSTACYVTKHSFMDGDAAVAFVSSIQLCTPPGEGVNYIGGGSNGNENQKAALAEVLMLDNTVPTIAFHITDDGPHLVANPHPVSDAKAEALYLKTKHNITDPDIFHVLSHVEEHFQGKLILNVVKYVKTAEHYRDHRLYGAIAKQFNGVLITPKVNDPQKLAAGLMEILTSLFVSFSGAGDTLSGGNESALDAFSFFDLDSIATLPTCEADVSQIVTPSAGSTSEVLYQLIERATVIVGKSFAKRAIKATGLQEQVELLLVIAKCLTKTISLNTALDRATSLLERIRELVPEENQGHIKIQAGDLPVLLSQNVAASASAELEAVVSAITLMSTEETAKTSLGDGDESEDETIQVVDPALLLQTAGSLFLGHLAVLQLPEKNGKVDFMDSWSAVIHKVSNDIMTAADFLQMLGGGTSTGGLSIRNTEYNYAQLFADPNDAVGSALLRVASGTQVLDILTGLLAGAPARQFTPNMFRGTISACLKMLIVQPASHAPVSSYQWGIVRKLVHSIRLLMGPRPKEMKADPESPLSKLLFQLLRLDTGKLEPSGKKSAATARAFLEEVLATLVQSMVKYREPEFLTLVEGMVGYEHVDVVEDITEEHALDQASWRIDPERAITFAAKTDLSDTFQICARNVLQTVFGGGDTSVLAPSLDEMWPRWQDELPKFVLLAKRTARYSLNKDLAAGADATPNPKQLEWVGNDALTEGLDSERYEALAMTLLRKKHDAFLRELRGRRDNEAAEQRWLKALKHMRAPFPEFVETLSKVVSSSSREHQLLLKAFKLHGEASLDPADYEAKLQVVITGRVVTDSEEEDDKIVFNRGNLHPHPDRFAPMSEEFKTKLRVLQQARQWKLSHTYRASGVPNHCGFSNSNPSACRLCSLCQQRYGSGLRDNVAASDILRARRMLIERGAAANDAEIRQGIELFLDGLTKQRELEGNQHLPLDVCAFCVQFLPSAYQEDKRIDDFRSQVLLGSASGASRSGAPPPHGQQQHQQQSAGASSAKRAYGSSLVIQHQFVKPAPPPQPQRPKSSSGAPSPSASEALSSPSSDTSSSSASSSTTRTPAPSSPSAPPKPSYRLLTNDITRVLRIESPRGALSIGGSNNLLVSEVMQNLQSQEKQQTAAILRSTRAKQGTRLRQRLHCVKMQAASASNNKPENIVHAIRASGAADSLYTGVVVSSSSSQSMGNGGKDRQRPPRPSVTSLEASQSQIKTQRNGRHLKTELLFPPL